MPSGTAGTQLDQGQADAICDAAVRLVSDVTSGNHTPVIITPEGKSSEVMPVDVTGGMDDGDGDGDGDGNAAGTNTTKKSRASSFMAGLDKVFTESFLVRARDAGASGTATRIKDLATQIAEQQKAVDIVMRRSESVGALARLLLGLAGGGRAVHVRRARPARA